MLPCSFNDNLLCTDNDLDLMYQTGDLVTGVATSVSTDIFDFHDDDIINSTDISVWLSIAATENGSITPYLRGDTELDRDIDITDFNALARNFDPTGDGDSQNGPFWSEGNFDGDDDIDITDFNILATNFSPVSYGTSAVPEPCSLLLMMLAGLCFIVRPTVSMFRAWSM